jgi:hypothetical protein
MISGCFEYVSHWSARTFEETYPENQILFFQCRGLFL